MAKTKKNKKKRWPVIVAVFVVLGLIGSLGDSDEETASNPNESPSASITTPAPEVPQESTQKPTQEPSPEPSTEPSESISPTPTEEPSPSMEPSPSSSVEPTQSPSIEPTSEPSPTPTPTPTPEPALTAEPSLTSTPEPTPSVEPEQAFRETLKQYAFVGSSESDKYHLPTCHWTSKINDENLVHFDTEEEAEAAGYFPCGTCLK